MDLLRKFLAENSHIQFAASDSPDFADLCSAFIINATKKPSLIVRPRSAEDISGLVSILTTNDIPFTIRGGGHDMFGRSQVDGAVTIDMREICHVHVDSASKTARVGGGIISMNLLKELEKHQMVTPHPVTPSVGYVGWAIHGGYGLLSTKYGLGVDQIVGATVVDANGNILEADERMLTVIRGGGGAVGVIVEVKTKIYPLDQVLAGAIIYQPSELVTGFRDFNTNFQQAKRDGFPPELGIYRFIMNGPTGKAQIVLFLWASSDISEGQKWLSTVSSWAPLGMSTVAPTTIAAFNEVTNSMVPKIAYGTIHAPIFRSLTPEVVDVIGKHALLQPNNPEVLFGIHELRADAPMSSNGSIFNARQAHVLIEIIPITGSLDTLYETMAWGQNFNDALLATDAANRLSCSYIPLNPTRDLEFKGIYGSQYETLREIKTELDPDNKFKHALVQL
ncbi:uncharacterized protein N7483_005345 [Penicillium malachiteum]|uniref:uncharacterized protein n=1 Tax=Penicillium malachiteum TaxID=1324776 RepID=UPI0025497D93|nr:uncharacterized protein N7483_005345 [Penicillium malachiteum]KAJ5730837.1 hypothetical protein N7483_005345 [Penicillium malachiteum]